MYRTFDEEIFLAPETIIWNALRIDPDLDAEELCMEDITIEQEAQ